MLLREGQGPDYFGEVKRARCDFGLNITLQQYNKLKLNRNKLRKVTKIFVRTQIYLLNQGCATFFTGGPLSKILTTSRASHRQICIKL